MRYSDILKIAAAEIGYREGPGNDSKYGKEYGLNGQPWCVMFLWWVFRKAGSDLFPQTAHCDGVRSFAKGIGRWFNHAEIGVGIDLQPGDIVVWDYDYDGSGDHIGIVETVVNNNRYVTIEGNYADSVCRVNRTLEGVSGVYRPNYAVAIIGTEEDETAPEAATDYPTMTDGSTGPYASLLQAKLAVLGYEPGDIDGEIGPMTMAAVRSYQADSGLTVDGIAGPETFRSLVERGV